MHDKLDELIYQIKYGDIPIELIECIYIIKIAWTITK